MPVKKIKNKNGGSARLLDKLVPNTPVYEPPTPIYYIGTHGKRVFLTLFGILLVYTIVWFATLIRNNLQEFDYIGYAEKLERTLTVTASEKITVKPDIAMTSIGMITHGETVTEAQEANTKVMNVFIAKVKEFGILDEDIKTQNYNVYPRYRYTEKEGQIADGYDVSQNIKITFRDVEKADVVIALAGELGANSVSGLQFDIDDPEIYKELARDKAIGEARIKALKLANTLGVKLIGIVDYSEYSVSNEPMLYKTYSESMGVGGSAPDIQEGTNELEVQVSIIYEIF